MKPRIKRIKMIGGSEKYKWFCGNAVFPVFGESPLGAYNYWAKCYPWLVDAQTPNTTSN